MQLVGLIKLEMIQGMINTSHARLRSEMSCSDELCEITQSKHCSPLYTK